MTHPLLLLSAGTFVSEDLACITAGALIASGDLPFATATLACFAGIAAGDLGLFYGGRLIGARLKPWLGHEKLQRASAWLAGNTAKAVLVSRFVPGTRTYTYIAAGVLRAPAPRFTGWFVIASAIWTPLLVGSAAFVGAQFTQAVFSMRGGAVLATTLLAVRGIQKLLKWETRRAIAGWFLRKARWEFWPLWAAYLPLVPGFLWLAFRHRSASVFTAANPAIRTGGLLDESKSDILSAIGEQSAVASWTAVRPGMRVETEREYPVVCKPDVGERGRGVSIVRSPEDLTRYISEASGTTIVQEYVGGLEFGIFYYRLPGELKGRISSITSKHFPRVTGDGVRTLKQLILADSRAVAISAVYLRGRGDSETFVPAPGESIQLVEVGAHCGGTIFLDGNHLKTDALERRVDEIARSFKGFYYGRFDVRSPSVEALQVGDLRILEVNGVAAEPTHIYDPEVSLLSAYRALWHHWHIAWKIGAANRAAGHRPASAGELLHLLAHRGRNLLRSHVDSLLSFRRRRRNVVVEP